MALLLPVYSTCGRNPLPHKFFDPSGLHSLPVLCNLLFTVGCATFFVHAFFDKARRCNREHRDRLAPAGARCASLRYACLQYLGFFSCLVALAGHRTAARQSAALMPWFEMQIWSGYISILVVLMCALLHLLLRPALGKRALCSGLLGTSFSWVPVQLVLAFAVYSPVAQAPLSSAYQKRRLAHRACGPALLFSTWQELVSQIGTCAADPPRYGKGSPSEASPNVHAVPPPWTEEIATGHRHDSWLGVYVFTPYYPTVTAAIKFEGTPTLKQAIQVVKEQVPGAPTQLFDEVAPLRPQRFPEFGSFVRFPSIIHHEGQHGHAAIILDLSRVGGRTFSTVLPKCIELEEVITFITPLTWYNDQPLALQVGKHQKLWSAGDPVHLRNGDVIVATHDAPVQLPQTGIDALFEDGAAWGALQHMPAVETTESVCLLFGEGNHGRRYCIPPHHHYNETFVQAAARCLGRQPHALSMCAFPVMDLDLHGDRCAHIVTAIDQPSPQQDGTPHSGRRDIFVLCDLRPLGQRPRFVHTSYPAVHLPSLVSTFGLETPPIYKIDVIGGVRDRDDIRLDGSTALLFYARLRGSEDGLSSSTSDSSSSEEDSPEEPEPIRARDPYPPGNAEIPGGHHADPRQWPQDYEDLVSQLDGPVTDNPASSSAPDVDMPPALVLTGTDTGTPSWHGSAHTQQPDTRASGAVPGTPHQQPAPSRSSAVDIASPAPSHTVDQADEAWMQILALIYVPSYVPELVMVPLRLPCGVDHAVQEVHSARADSHAQHFPRLYVAQPQLSPAFAVFTAGPEWDTEQAIVLIDKRQIDGAVFAKAVHTPISRESLLHAAGFAGNSDHQVFTHGLLQALARGQRIRLFPGMVVSFVAVGANAPATSDFPTMLLSRDQWDFRAPLPGPPYTVGGHFSLLTDGGMQGFQVGPGRRASFRQDVASQLLAPPEALTIKPTAPRVRDHLCDGHISTEVLVVTEQLSRLPCPPARQREDRVILVLDCRRILRGFQWQVCPEGRVSIPALVDRFLAACPDGYSVSITGATVHTRDDVPFFLFDSGCLLTVDFVENLLSDEVGPESHGPPGGPPRDQGHPADRDPSGDDQASTVPRDRSRAGTSETGAGATAPQPPSAERPHGPDAPNASDGTDLGSNTFAPVAESKTVCYRGPRAPLESGSRQPRRLSRSHWT
ncbi:unnamed protein product [Symbiodinium sp. CCMP2592]|nr:unnamed protein product [Symbiodinium sp. CCMP2592]